MIRITLRLLSKLYASIMTLRWYFYERGYLRSYKSSLPIICVGNISAGGSGKTPLCIFLVEALREKGYRPAVLTRGYGGKQRGPYQVKEDDKAENCGDEALLIAKKASVPVVVAAKRADGAKYIEKNNLGDLIILDDGFQHFALRRTVDIVLLNVASEDAVKDLLHDRVLPWGKLRESAKPALNRADFIVLSRRKPASESGAPDPALMQILPQNRALFNCFFEGSSVVSCLDSQQISPRKVFAFCAIANPESFFDTLKTIGFEVVDKAVFSDHHFISAAELEILKKKAGDLTLVCTEKDAVRLDSLLLKDVYKLCGKAKVIPGDAFLVQIEKRLLVAK